MLLGRPILSWILWAFVAVCVFVLAKWAIPLLFGLVGVTIPDQVVTVLCLLLAVGVLWGGWRSGPVAP